MKKILLISMYALLTIGSMEAKQKQPYKSTLKKKEVTKVCNSVANWQIAHINDKHKGDHNVLGWVNATFYKGLAEWGKTGNQHQYYGFLNKVGDDNGWKLLPNRPYHADDICVSQMYIDMYRVDNNRKKIEPTLKTALMIANNPSSAPFTKTDKRGANDRWSWCDALFMAPPVYAALYTITGEKVLLDYMNSEYKVCVDSLYSTKYDLFYRDDRKKSLREPNGAEQFWARGNGWVIGGLVNVIDNLPKDEPSRQYYIDLFQKLASGIVKCQQPDGSWHASLLDPEAYSTPENSASAFICYGFAWGLRNGYLDKATYEKPMLRAWGSLVSHVYEDGKLGFVQPIGESPKHITANSTEVYGPGAFLLAGAEIYLISK